MYMFLATASDSSSSNSSSSASFSAPSSASVSSFGSFSPIDLATPLLMSTYFADENKVLQESKEAAFKATFSVMFDRLKDFLSVHDGADQMSSDFLSNRLPPFSGGSIVENSSATLIRLVEPSAFRMSVEKDEEGSNVLGKYLLSYFS